MYEQSFELRCHLDSIQELIAQGAKSIIIKVQSENGEMSLEMFGDADAELNQVVRLVPATLPGACPMPCSRRPTTPSNP